MKNRITLSNNYILRSPLLSLNFYHDLTQSDSIESDLWRKIWDNKLIKESIYIASPSLCNNLDKWLKGGESKNEKKLKLSLLKYLTRMSSRCTPFGTFSGVTLGCFSKEKSSILLDDIHTHKKHTRLDMNFLVSFSQELSKIQEIKNEMKYYPNSSMYRIGNEIRYVEYYYFNGERIHNIISVSNSKYLNIILNKAVKGRRIKELVNDLLECDISKKDAEDFINELIESQILISQIEPSLTGDDSLKQICNILSKSNANNYYHKSLESIRIKIEELDNIMGKNIKDYELISDELKKVNITINYKHLFQVDLKLKTIKNHLNNKIKQDALKALQLLATINRKESIKLLEDFTEAFSNRYGDKKMNMAYVLDPEIGIGFKQNKFLGEDDINPLLDDLIIMNNAERKTIDLKWDVLNMMILKKIEKAQTERESNILITNKDLEFFDLNLNGEDELGVTASALAELHKIDGEEMLVINNIGHSSASNLINRLGHIDNCIYNLIETINTKEDEFYKDKMVAEIIHLPDDRVGNILSRPINRNYEIPYLSNSSLPSKHQILIEDIEISLDHENRIILTSSISNKEIIPFLSTAHFFNYRNALPIYQFLCNVQGQYGNSLGFNYMPIEFSYIPRIQYKNIILQKAIWRLELNEIEEFNKIVTKSISSKDLISQVEIFRKKLGIPEYIALIDGDNELLIKLSHATSIEMLYDLIKKRSTVKFKEYLFEPTNCIVKNKNGEGFTNQIILTYFKSIK